MGGIVDATGHVVTGPLGAAGGVVGGGLGGVGAAGRGLARGELKGAGFGFEVHDTQKPADGIILHMGRVLYGAPQVGMKVMAGIDRYRRGQMRRNHTATHLLNGALRDVVDASIKQAGSLVGGERWRGVVRG